MINFSLCFSDLTALVVSFKAQIETARSLPQHVKTVQSRNVWQDHDALSFQIILPKPEYLS